MYNTVLDYMFGTLLTLVSILGSTFNALSFLYFSKLTSRNTTAEFFRYLYMVITCNDTVISLCIVPLIDSAFSKGRGGVLANNSGLCNVWVFALWIFPQMSIFLVGFLSVSRLVILRYPEKKVYPRSAIIVPALIFLTILTIIVLLRTTGVMYPVYIPQWLTCAPSTFAAERNRSDLISPAELTHATILSLPYNVIPVISILPITLSFFLSLQSLYKSGTIAVTINSSTKRQREAAKTVVIVTLLYIIFNIPYTVFTGVIMSRVIPAIPSTGISLADYMDSRVIKITNSQLDNYLAFMVLYLAPVLNSCFNPVVYYSRIRSFHSGIKALNLCRVCKSNKVKAKPQYIQQTTTRDTSI